MPVIYFGKERISRTSCKRFFLKVKNDHFLISAAHVFDIGTSEVSILTENALHTIGGELNITTQPLSDLRNDAKIDIAILKISDSEIEKIQKKYSFLDLKDFLLDFKTPVTQQYLVVGHPVTRTKINPTKSKISSNPFIFATPNRQGKNYILSLLLIKQHMY